MTQHIKINDQTGDGTPRTWTFPRAEVLNVTQATREDDHGVFLIAIRATLDDTDNYAYEDRHIPSRNATPTVRIRRWGDELQRITTASRSPEIVAEAKKAVDLEQAINAERERRNMP